MKEETLTERLARYGIVLATSHYDEREEMVSLLARLNQRAYERGKLVGYKLGVEDEIECVKTSGEHLDLQEKLCKDLPVGMKAQKFYLTKLERPKLWHYITDPTHPTSVQQMGLIEIQDIGEVGVDDFGAYITRWVK